MGFNLETQAHHSAVLPPAASRYEIVDALAENGPLVVPGCKYESDLDSRPRNETDDAKQRRRNLKALLGGVVISAALAYGHNNFVEPERQAGSGPAAEYGSPRYDQADGSAAAGNG